MTLKLKPLVVYLSVLMLVAGCEGVKQKPVPDKVNLQLKFMHQAQFAGIYLALEKGYYAAQNLDVNLIVGGIGIKPLDALRTGEADLAIASPGNIIEECANGDPFLAIATIFRKDPLTFISRPEARIRNPQGFLGKKAAISTAHGVMILKAMMQKMELDVSKISLFPVDYRFGTFISGEVDLSAGYATGSLVRLREKGVEFETIRPDDYGIHFYSDTIATTRDFARDKNDLTLRFLRATLRGWREATEDPEAAVDATMKYAVEADRDLQMKMMQASLPMIHTGVDHIGWMDPAIWQVMHDLLLAEGAITDSIDINGMFTDEFLKKIYN